MSRALNPECEHVDGDMRTARLGRQFDGVFAPDFVRENFRPSTDHGGYDNADGTRGLRYLEWTSDPDPSDTTYVVDYAFVLRTGGDVRVEHDRHVEGLLGRADWLRLLTEAGFEARAVPFEHSEVDNCTLEVFVAKKPGR